MQYNIYYNIQNATLYYEKCFTIQLNLIFLNNESYFNSIT